MSNTNRIAADEIKSVVTVSPDYRRAVVRCPMPLAEYLASEQARDRLKTADVLTMPSASEWHGHGQRVVIEQCKAWWRVSVTVADETISSYYRANGDRYVVTDLGEGVRALRLKGVALREIKPRVDAVMMAMWQEQTEFVAHFPAALIEGEIGTVNQPRAESLPDAICRVMLASLRVAQS